MENSEKVLQVTNLSFFRDQQPILKELNFSLTHGSPFALVGESGSGKTTFLFILASLLHAHAGTVEVNGKILQEMSPRVRAQNLGIVFQDYQLFPHLSVLENLSVAPRLHHFPQIHDQAMGLLDDLGIAELAARFPFELSGGQKQRVAIARSLMLSPKLLLLDEPSSALDMQRSQELAALLLKLSGRTQIFVVSHDLAFIDCFCTRVAKMNDGKIEWLNKGMNS